jgi:hypothetical protein
MWTQTNDIIAISKAEDVKINNVFVVETDYAYYLIGLDKIPERQTLYTYNHPINHLRGFIERLEQSKQRTKIYFVINGVVIQDDKGICNFCNNKFKGYTGTCSFLKFETKCGRNM